VICAGACTRGSLYSPNVCAAMQIKSEYYLVSLVENDYVDGDLFSLLEGL